VLLQSWYLCGRKASPAQFGHLQDCGAYSHARTLLCIGAWGRRSPTVLLEEWARAAALPTAVAILHELKTLCCTKVSDACIKSEAFSSTLLADARYRDHSWSTCHRPTRLQCGIPAALRWLLIPLQYRVHSLHVKHTVCSHAGHHVSARMRVCHAEGHILIRVGKSAAARYISPASWCRDVFVGGRCE